MTFQQFKHRYKTELSAVNTALFLLMTVGSAPLKSMSAGEVSDLILLNIPDPDEDLEKALPRAAGIAVQLAGTDLSELPEWIAAAASGGTLEKEDICPSCGGTLSFGEDASMDQEGCTGWRCHECGATGTATYREIFTGHRDVRIPGED